MSHYHQRHIGQLCMFGSALCFSTVALFTHLIKLPLAETLVIRGITGAIAICFVAYTFTNQKIFKRANLNWPSYAVAILFAAGMTILVAAYAIGSTITVSICYATLPLIISLIELILYKKKPPAFFLFSCLGVIAGISIMSLSGLSHRDFWGMTLGMLMTLCIAGVIIITRAHPHVPMLAGSTAACILSSIISIPFLGHMVFSWIDIAICALFGVITLGLGRVFLILGASKVPARDAALIDVLDAPLTPLWTYFLLGQNITLTKIIGAAIIIFFVIYGICKKEKI